MLDELPISASAGPAQGPAQSVPQLATESESSSREPPSTRDAIDPILMALGHDPVTLDQLVARTGWSASALGAHLLELELDDAVCRLPGGLYQRRSTA